MRQEQQRPRVSKGRKKSAALRLDKRANAYSIHQHLRGQIVTGDIPSGTVLSQLALAREIGVSRTPIREAIRMLQNEGLVEARPNSRAKVKGFSASVLDAVYALRVFLEPLGIALSIPRMTENHLTKLDECLERMLAAEKTDDFHQWVIEHRSFHQLLVAFCGEGLHHYISRLLEQSTRFQYLFIKVRGPAWKKRRDRDHIALVEACRKRRLEDAYRLILAHVAETGLTLLDEFPSEQGRPPGTAINAAIAIASAGIDQLTKFEGKHSLNSFTAILGQ
jgi:DNA-binding GntR family transcriptional regulator